MAEEKTKYSNEDLAMFNVLIDQKLTHVKEQLDFYQHQMSEMAHSADAKIKALDDVSTTIEAERISELVVRTKKHITHLQNAKLRISNKVFGICRQTGKLISKERLKAVPHATLSIEAKQSR